MNKKHLTIEELKQQRPNLEGYAADFADDASASYSTDIYDAITEFADSNTSIYYGDIMNFISENPYSVDDAINKIGWDGCGNELYKAGQVAELLTIEREVYDNLENIIKNIAIDYLIDINAQITTEQLEVIFDALGNIDHNNRFDDIADAINNIINEK